MKIPNKENSLNNSIDIRKLKKKKKKKREEY